MSIMPTQKARFPVQRRGRRSNERSRNAVLSAATCPRHSHSSRCAASRRVFTSEPSILVAQMYWSARDNSPSCTPHSVGTEMVPSAVGSTAVHKPCRLNFHAWAGILPPSRTPLCILEHAATLLCQGRYRCIQSGRIRWRYLLDAQQDQALVICTGTSGRA